MARIGERAHVLVARVATCRDCTWTDQGEALAALVRAHLNTHPAHLVDVNQTIRITYGVAQ